MNIVQLPIQQLKLAEYNPRQISAQQFDALNRSIKEFGFVEPVVVNQHVGRENIIVGGHMRVRAAQQLGMSDVPCVYVDLDEQKEKLLNIALNKISGEWDEDKLNELVYALSAEGADISISGLSDEEVSICVDSVSGDEKQEEELPPAPEQPISKRGEVYELGRHRLMCGDSANAEDLKLLLNGSVADMLFTDPPYGVDIGEKNRFLNSFQPAGRNLTDIANDMLSGDELFDLLVSAFRNARESMKDTASFYVTAPQGGELGLMMMMMSAGLPVRHVLNWVKNSPTFSMGRLDYDYQHEPILYGWKKTHHFYGGGQFTKSVWKIDKPHESKEHPTMKPVELMENAIKNSTMQGQSVLDIFGGSGSTLLACEKTGRTCYMMELEPRYCDVIRKRYENYVNTQNATQ